jgi:hypothetical protein
VYNKILTVGESVKGFMCAGIMSALERNVAPDEM